MRTSLRQIAERAGVSPQTVSNVLNNRAGRVSAETRQRVVAAIEDLEYIPIRRPAMQNRHVETHAIGVAFMDDQKFLQDTRERLGLYTFAGMRDRARKRAYDLLLLFHSRSEWFEAGAERRFLDRRYDGIIFVGQCPTALLESLAKHQLPTVVCYSPDTPPGVASVLVDNAAAMRLAVDHLIQHGHERIAHLAGPRWSREAAERRDHYRDAMRERGRPECAHRIVQGDTWGGHLEETRPLADAILDMGVTGIVCGNDFLALDLMQIARKCKLRVPADLSVIGMDNLEEGMAVGLTSIVNPFYQIGSQAVDALLFLLQGGDYRQASRRISVELVSRRSVGTPKPASPKGAIPHLEAGKDKVAGSALVSRDASS